MLRTTDLNNFKFSNPKYRFHSYLKWPNLNINFILFRSLVRILDTLCHCHSVLAGSLIAALKNIWELISYDTLSQYTFAIIWMGSMKYKTNALYSIDPFQTQKWAHKKQWTLWKQKSKLAWQHTEQSQAMMQNPFRHELITHRRPKPQRGYIRVSHQSPP